MDYFDLSRDTNLLASAFLNASHLKYLAVSFTSDWLYPSYHSKELVGALTGAGADVTYLDIKSNWGHDAFLLEVETMTNLLGSFLGRLAREEQVALPEPMTLTSPIITLSTKSKGSNNPDQWKIDQPFDGKTFEIQSGFTGNGNLRGKVAKKRLSDEESQTAARRVTA